MDSYSNFIDREARILLNEQRMSQRAKVTGEPYVPLINGVRMPHFDLNDPTQAAVAEESDTDSQ